MIHDNDGCRAPKKERSVSFFEVEDWEIDYLSVALAGYNLKFFGEPLTAATAHLAADAEAVSIFIYSRIDAETIAKLHKTKFVTTRSMGFDHVDLVACKKRNVKVARVPAYGEKTVAEHAFALILSLSRKIYAAHERTKRANFDYRGLRGFDLHGKTIGIVGAGRIGMHVARIAKRGFGMNVLVADPFPKFELAAEIGFEYLPLEALLPQSDVITLHAPLTPETRHLINEQTIAKIKRGALLVNTSRGALVETKALLKALQNGILSGAGLDVLEEEGFIKAESEIMGEDFPEKCDLASIVRSHMLFARNDVVVTPHIAFNSREAVERILSVTVENINAYLEGRLVDAVG